MLRQQQEQKVPASELFGLHDEQEPGRRQYESGAARYNSMANVSHQMKHWDSAEELMRGRITF